MKEYIHNYNNLLDKNITETIIRIKVLLIQNHNIILGNERNIYQFSGAI